MLQRRMLWMFGLLILLVAAIGLFTLRGATRTSDSLDRLIDETGPTLHSLTHLRAASERLLLEAERFTIDAEPAARIDALENARSSFEDALAEYEVTGTLDEDVTHLTLPITESGTLVLGEAAALLAASAGGEPSGREAILSSLQSNERELAGYLREAIALESDELVDGDTTVGDVVRSRHLAVVLAATGGLILAMIFGSLLIRQAGATEEAQAQLQRAKEALEQEVAARTESLQQANRALHEELERRDRAESALRSSETAYRTLAENLPGAVYRLSLGSEHRIHFFNERAKEITGYGGRELGHDGICPLIELIRPEEQARVAAVVEEALQSKQPFSVEYHLRHRDGSERILQEQGSPLYDSDDQPLCIDGVIFDITERDRAEAALEQSEERFRVAAEEALVGIYIIQENSFRYVNPAIARYLGYESEQLTDTVSPLDLVHPADREGVALRMRQRLSGVVADAPHIFRGLHRDGSEVLLESIARVVQYQDRPAIIGTMRDITQQREADLEIRQRNRELQALLSISQRLAGEFELQERLQAITDVIVQTMAAADAASLWLYDEDRQHLTLNAWSGYQEEEIANLNTSTAEALARLVSEAGQPRLVMGRKSAVRQTSGDDKHSILGVPIMLEGVLLGTLFADAFSPKRTFDQHDLRLLQAVAGETAIAVKNARLLETTRRHQRELQQLSQQLLAAREAEARRISRELHDVMGQSLTAISINLAEVQQELGARMTPRTQERLEESETLTTETLNQVRELSLELRPSMLDDLGLVPTLRWYLHRFGQRLDIPASLVTEGVSQRMAPEVETILYRVVQEGLTNVARHAQPTSVQVTLSGDRRRIDLTVEDDGVGFDVACLETAEAGAHMGLLGVRERVALLGGTLHIDSAPGHGTRLLIHLPYLTRAPLALEQQQDSI